MRRGRVRSSKSSRPVFDFYLLRFSTGTLLLFSRSAGGDVLEGISFHLHASGRLSDEERDAALLSVAGRCEDIVRRRVQERCYIPSLLLSALVFLLVYLFLSLAVRDPVPMVDELLAASVLSVLCFALIRRRAAGGALYRNIMLSCRRELGILREDEDEAIGRLEDYYESLCRYDIQAMADILAHRGGENPPPFRGELTEGLSAALRQYAVKDDPRCWHYMKMLAGNRPDRRLGAILVQSALSDGLDLCLLYILCQLIPR